MKIPRLVDGFVLLGLYRISLAVTKLVIEELEGIWGEAIKMLTMPLFVGAGIVLFGVAARFYFSRRG